MLYILTYPNGVDAMNTKVQVYNTSAKTPEEAVDTFHRDYTTKMILRNANRFYVIVSYAGGFVSVYFS